MCHANAANANARDFFVAFPLAHFTLHSFETAQKKHKTFAYTKNHTESIGEETTHTHFQIHMLLANVINSPQINANYIL